MCSAFERSLDFARDDIAMVSVQQQRRSLKFRRNAQTLNRYITAGFVGSTDLKARPLLHPRYGAPPILVSALTQRRYNHQPSFSSALISFFNSAETRCRVR